MLSLFYWLDCSSDHSVLDDVIVDDALTFCSENHTIKFMAIIVECDNAIQERNIALTEKIDALAERDMAILQRDTAIARAEQCHHRTRE